jgi:hypothetical protein
MNLYQKLPDGDPVKASGLREAMIRWRLSVMPDYVQEALHSDTLDREQLAVVLVSLAPKLETLPGGEVPLLSDIMKLPSQREIVAAVRLGLLEADRVEHLFLPHRQASAIEARAAIGRLGSLLSLDSPRWCSISDSPCTELDEPISGDAVSSIVIDMLTRNPS